MSRTFTRTLSWLIIVVLGSTRLACGQTTTPAPGPTVLWPGEVVLTGYTATDGAPDWGFAPLVDLAPGTQLQFTNRGWRATGGFRAGESTATYTVPAAGLAKGQAVVYSTAAANFTGALTLASSGDQLLVYQGSEAAPTFVTALTYPQAWAADATSDQTSTLPPGLTLGTNALSLPTANAAMTNAAVRQGLPAALRAAYATPLNWTGGGAQVTPPTATLTVSEGLVPDAVELAVLRDIHTSTQGANWSYDPYLSGARWLQGTNNAEHWATWRGLQTAGGDIVAVDLNINNLQGTLPSSLGDLTQLTFLKVTNNPGLTGSLPATIGQLRQLRYLRTTRTKLSGNLPPELAQLSQLTDLYLDQSLFSGPIPAWLGSLSNLKTLVLLGNRLTGTIPKELGDLAQLTTLILSNYATIKPGEGNMLTGGIPPELGRLTNLTYLDLSVNPLGGTIPKELGQLRNLTFLELDNCHLSGVIPPEVFALPKLTELYLGYPNYGYQDPNAFTALPAPNLLSNKSTLHLDASYNQFDFGDLELYFTGPGQHPFRKLIVSPQETPAGTDTARYRVGQALTLRRPLGGQYTRYQWQRRSAGAWQDLAGAQDSVLTRSTASAADSGAYRVRATNDWVTGLTLTSKPVYAKGDLADPRIQALREFYEATDGDHWLNHSNWPSGPAAWQAVKTMSQCQNWFGLYVVQEALLGISLPDNNLRGQLPTSLGQLPDLTYLYLQRNQLTGQLPASLGQLTRLTALYAGNNALSGLIPASLGQLSGLEQLGLDRNRFAGGVPTSFGQLTRLRVLYLNTNELNGSFPSVLLQCAQLRALYLGENKFTGVVPTTLSQLTLLTELGLDENQFTEAVPASLTQVPVVYLYLHGSGFTGLPSWKGAARVPSDFYVHNNLLDFAALEANFTAANTPLGKLYYAPQRSRASLVKVQRRAGTAAQLNGRIGGAYNRYQWQRWNGEQAQWVDLPGQTQPDLAWAAVAVADAGRYQASVTNSWVAGLILYSDTYELDVPAQELPPSEPSADLNRNWTYSRTYDLAGNVTSESKQFVDALGRPTQSQAKNLAEHHVFATQSLNNSGGVAVLATLPAPTNNQEFKYKEGFVTATAPPAGGGAPVRRDYAPRHFEQPTGGSSPVPLDEDQRGTLGYYYSPNNTWEPAIAATHNPYSLSEPLAGPLGGMRRAAGPGDELRLGSGREMRGRDFPLLNELDHYSQLRARFVPGSPTPSLRAQGVKVVSVNANGTESISFSNREGQALASCLSGDEYKPSTLTGRVALDPPRTADIPVYQDLHITASATPTTVTVTEGAAGGAASGFVVIDLLQNPAVEKAYSGAQSLSLAPGFYRLQATSGQVSFSYPVRYGNFSYVFYDDAGRAVASIAAKGVAELLPEGLDTGRDVVPGYVTRNVFDTSGRVLSTSTTDEGTTRYVYARDGRIRFSQSALQANPGTGKPRRFSYSNYDQLGRIVESGEYTQATDASQGLVFEDMLTETPVSNSVLQAALLEERTSAGALSAGSLAVARLAQRQQVWYDVPQPDAALGTRQQDFLLGAVAKTSNGTSSTWYSYNDLGQLTWLVQKAPAPVGTKTVDYTYDAAGNVTQVTYQQGQPDAFYHYYTYDANQRLVTVVTSPDGVARTEQARYHYYLHGPLKRVETAGTLQGTDYTYTVQGWLKSINGANRSLNADKPGVNGFQKDLFGLTLDYFRGDYRSAQASPATPTIANAPATRYDGTVRSAAWYTAANPAVRQHVFTYDAKGQLKQSDFGQLLPGATPTAAGTFVLAPRNGYEEGNLSYDPNGNLGSLRRRNGQGDVTDEFKYDYLAGTNKLAAVRNPAGAAVLDYDYDATGQMTRQKDEKGQRYLNYDVTGKVTGVYRDEARQQKLIVFTYDDRGFRASKQSYDPTTFQLKQTTYSVRDAAGNELSTYVQDAVTPGSTLQRSEVPLYGASRLGTLTRLDDGSLDYRYELNDQLGNARVIYHKPTTTTYTATLEPDKATPEEKDFTNVASTRFAAPGRNGSTRVARLGMGSGRYVGPSKTLSVQPGDTVTFTAYAWLTAAATTSAAQATTQTARSTSSLMVLTAPLNARPLPPLTPGAERGRATSANPLTRLSVGVGILLGSKRQAAANALGGTTQAGTGTSGNAQLHYLVKDKDGKVVLDQYQNANPGTPGTWQQLQVGLRLAQGGTVELSVESDGASGPDVYFDDLEIKHAAGTIVQEQHQYAFGAPMLGLNYTVGSKNYRHGYQGQFAEKDEETGWDNFELRMYDSRIGRWMAPDPYGQFDSPYVGMGNNPVSSVDPDGGFSLGVLWGQVKSAIGLGHMVGAAAGQNLKFVADASLAWQSIGNAFVAVGQASVAAAPYGVQIGVGAANTAARVSQQGSGQQGPGKPKPKSKAMAAAAAASLVLIADDVTGVGTADDILIPFLFGAAYLSDIFSIPRPGEVPLLLPQPNHVPGSRYNYYPAPTVLPGFPGAERIKSKSQRRRWANPNGDILEWDSQHGEVEVYTGKGKHKGAYDPETGKPKPNKPGKKNRSIEL